MSVDPSIIREGERKQSMQVSRKQVPEATISQMPISIIVVVVVVGGRRGEIRGSQWGRSQAHLVPFHRRSPPSGPASD